VRECETRNAKNPQEEHSCLFFSAHRARNARSWSFVRQRTDNSPIKADCEAGYYAGFSAQASLEFSMEHAMDVFTNDKLVTDINTVLSDAESLLSATADQGGEKMVQLRTKAEASLRLARRQMAHAQNAMLERTRETARMTDVYVHENPWNAMGAAAGFGLLLGFLLGRR
jgi:ElaB/YqjD/DUF883 family membrane-anchored ribosome-binding protein